MFTTDIQSLMEGKVVVEEGGSPRTPMHGRIQKSGRQEVFTMFPYAEIETAEKFAKRFPFSVLPLISSGDVSGSKNGNLKFIMRIYDMYLFPFTLYHNLLDSLVSSKPYSYYPPASA